MRRHGLALIVVGCAVVAWHAESAVALQPDAADQALVTAALLRSSDFPPGWREGPGSSPADFTKFGAVCRPIVNALKRRVARGASSDFSQGDEVVGDGVAVFRATGGAAGLLAAFQGPRASACVLKGLNAAVARSASKARVHVTSVALGGVSTAPMMGADETFIYEAVIRSTRNGRDATIYDDVTNVRVGRVAIDFAVSKVGSSPSRDFGAEFQAAVNRVLALR